MMAFKNTIQLKKLVLKSSPSDCMVDTFRCNTSNARVSLVDDGDRPNGIC